MAPTPPLPPFHGLETGNGPIMIGFAVECLLFGLLIAQICIYAKQRKCHRDRALMQSLVYTLCFVELFRFIVIFQSAWGLLVQMRGPGRVASSTPLAMTLPSLAGFESATVQIFFAWRIWSMRREERPYLFAAVIIMMIAITQTGGSVALSYQIGRVVAHAQHSESDRALVTAIWLGGSFACDLLIVITMALILIGVRKETAFKETEKIINYLLRLIVETGALTVVAATVMLGLHQKYPQESYCLGILFILGGLYTNIFLFLLNSREKPRDALNEISLHFASNIQGTSSSSQPIGESLDLTSRARSSKE